LVWLDADGTEAGQGDRGYGALVEMLTDQVTYLRSQLDQERQTHAEARRIIGVGLVQRVPELEASGPSEPRESTGGSWRPPYQKPRAALRQAHKAYSARSGGDCSGARLATAIAAVLVAILAYFLGKRQTVDERLYTKRSEVIAALFERFEDMDQKVWSLVKPFEFGSEPDKKTRIAMPA